MHRRLLSTAATTSRLSIAPSTIPRFPPKESHPPPKDSFAFERESFDAASWASLHPPSQRLDPAKQLSRLLKGVARQDFTTAMDAFYKQILLAAVPEDSDDDSDDSDDDGLNTIK